MSCTKNPKKWFVFKWLGDHEWKTIHVAPFMRGGRNFEAHQKCLLCGAREMLHFLKWTDLLEMGLTNEQIEYAQSNDTGLFIDDHKEKETV